MGLRVVRERGLVVGEPLFESVKSCSFRQLQPFSVGMMPEPVTILLWLEMTLPMLLYTYIYILLLLHFFYFNSQLPGSFNNMFTPFAEPNRTKN